MAAEDYRHDPSIFFETSSAESSAKPPRSLLILNSPIASPSLLRHVWNSCDYVVCADGGANRLYDVFGADEEARRTYRPDAIHGDLDSLKDAVRVYYAGLDVPITKDPDQYSTDFGKCVGLTQQRKHRLANAESVDPATVVILGSIGGRVDQGIGLLSEMVRHQSSSRHGNAGSGEAHAPLTLYLVSESSVTFILPPGETAISFPPGSVPLPGEGSARKDSRKALFTPNVGILPLLGTAHITIQGFEWDVDDWKTEVGGAISTNNHIFANEVKVRTDMTVLFTVELDDKYFSP